MKIDPKLLKSLKVDLARLSALEEAATEYGKVEKRVKEALKAQGSGDYDVGEFHCCVEERPRVSYEVPQEVKDKFKVEAVSIFVSWRKV